MTQGRINPTPNEAAPGIGNSGAPLVGHSAPEGEPTADIQRERANTDESLQTEREKTDAALAIKQRVIGEQADAVVDLARNNADTILGNARVNADEVLEAAREKADDLLAMPGDEDKSHATLIGERHIADELLCAERAVADETLRQERSQFARTLDEFLPDERNTTDRHLGSERRRSDTALENRDDFLAMVTHDLRDLVGGISLSSKLLLRSASGADAGKVSAEQAGRIDRYAARMKRLIGDLVDLTSIDAGKLRIEASTNDAAALLTEVTDAFRSSASAQAVRVDSEIAPGQLIARFDYDRILQVLANLVSNSLKFTGRQGKIVVRAERAGEELHISVSDSGCGVPEDALERIFQRFSQIASNQRRGLGLGLYISRCIVEAHGGRIWAQSTLGTGTTVRFALPVSGEF